MLSRYFENEVALLAEGTVALTPNLVEFPEELDNDVAFASKLARSLDVYVLDDVRVPPALGLRQRLAARAALPRVRPHLAAPTWTPRGFSAPLAPAPYVGVVGGDSFARKSKLLWALLLHADAVVLGGVVANTCLAAEGWPPAPATTSRAAGRSAPLSWPRLVRREWKFICHATSSSCVPTSA